MSLAPQDWPPPSHHLHIHHDSSSSSSSQLHHHIHIHHHQPPDHPHDNSSSKHFLSASNLFACFPPPSIPRPRAYPPNSVPHSGVLSHSGPIKVSSGPIIGHSGPLIGHSGPLKGPTKAAWPSIIPADVIGRKTPSGYHAQEPTSPEVTCLGRVKIKPLKNRSHKVREVDHKQHVSESKISTKQHVGESKISTVEKKTESLALPGKAIKQLAWKKNWGVRESIEPGAQSGKIDFEIDLDRFGSACAVLSSISSEAAGGRAERRAILTKSLVHWFGKNRSETSEDEYVPELPPPNALLLIRGSRNLERESGQPGFHAEPDDQQLPHESHLSSIKRAINVRRQVSLPKPPPESSLWKRRGIGEISSLNISKPIKLEISLPSTR